MGRYSHLDVRTLFPRSHPLPILLAAVLILASRAVALDPLRPVREYRVAEWGMRDGLPYPSIAALAQSADGYLWIATRNGLARFDGVTFTTFTHATTPSIGDDRITALLAARDGTLWIGTARGITWYRDGTWSRPAFGTAIDEGGIIALAETSGERIFIAQSVDRATSKGVASGMFVRQSDNLVEIKLPNGEEMPRIDTVAEMPDGTVVFGGVGLFEYREGQVHDTAKDHGLTNPRYFAALAEPDGVLWLGGPFGLSRSSAAAQQAFSTGEGLPSNSIRSFLRDHDGNIWVGTSNGLARFSGNNAFQPLLLHGVESLSNVICQCEDAEGNLWIGTDNGLFRVQDVKVATFSQRDGLPVNPTLCVLETRDHTRWIGTIGGGLAHLTPDGIHALHRKDGLKEESVGALAETADGTLWIAYYTKGLSSYSQGKFTHYSPGAGVRFRGLAVDSNDRVWAASSDGVFRLENGAFERVALDPAIDFPRALHINRAGEVWVAGGHTFGCWRNGKWTIYPKRADLELQPFQSIFTGDDGTVWVLQDGPYLWRVRQGEVRPFEFPALGPLIYTGFEKDGDLWINFRAGVARIPLRELDAVGAGQKRQPAYTLYNDADGMRSRAPNNAASPGSAIMSDGTLWFSTSMGVAQINPARIRSNPVVPPVHIEQVLVDKVEYAGDTLRHIPPGRGEVAFRFTALSFVNPGQVRFKYRLHGFDANWIDGGATREAHYGGLSPGTYQFSVLACNNEGIWNGQPAQCTFMLEPHYYQEWWFFVAIGLAFSGGGAGLIRWRSLRLERRARALQRQNRELEHRIAERTTELRQSYAALQSSEFFYHSLVESLPQVILRKDASGRYTYANDLAAELFGRPVAEIVGHRDDEIWPAEQARELRAEDEQVLARRQPMEREEIVGNPGAPKRYLHVKRVPLYDAQGQSLGIQVLYWDMTVFRETEDKLRHAQRELVEFSRLAGIAEMATGVLHNLGNALNSVKVAASIARDKIVTLETSRIQRVAELLERENLAEYLQHDERGTKLPHYLTLLGQQLEGHRKDALGELQQLVNGIEHVAQIIAAQQEGARAAGIVEVVDPKELIEYACRVNQARLERHHVIIAREFMPAPAIAVDRQRALQILANLVYNAIDAVAESNRAEKKITFAVRSTARTVQLAVIDNGTGIAPENLPHLFEFGFTTKPRGHGFGLHNSAIAARQLGGKLEVHSDGPGSGATFVLELPLKPPDN